ncbi:MAG: ribonuclease J [Sphingomonadales bacterium]
MTIGSLDPRKLYFLPLGGCGEIGMNLNLYGFGGKWIMVDLGVMFADDKLPGVDLILPDTDFIEERRGDLLAIVLTHAHEDHFGAVAHLWPRLRCPIHATAFTAELLRSKLSEAGLLDEVPLHVVPLGGSIDLDPFEVAYVTLTHSILEPNALAIKTQAGTVMHTGDWKLDPEPQLGEATDEARLKEFGDAGVLAMVCDSTNVFVPGRSGSEAGVRTNLEAAIAKCKGRVAVTAFASNVARLRTIALAGAVNDRHVVLVGRSIRRAVAAARATGYLADLPKLLDDDEAGYLPADKVLYICTGSQGEPRGAMARIANGDHPHVTLGEGDSVIFSSRQIPGNERAIYALYNQLVHCGVQVITEQDHAVHVSGHPCRDELADMYQWVRPQIAVPVHGEGRHLVEHAKFAKMLQVPTTIVPENGSLVELCRDGARIVEQLSVDRLVVDGTRIVHSDGQAMVERRRLMYNGHISVSLAVDAKCRLLSEPRVTMMGVPWEGDSSEIIIAVQQAIEAALAGLGGKQARSDDAVGETARIAARRTCRLMTGKKPIAEVQVIRLKVKPAT